MLTLGFGTIAKGWTAMQVVAGVAGMTKLMPMWMVAMSAEAASAKQSFDSLFVRLPDPYPHIKPR